MIGGWGRLVFTAEAAEWRGEVGSAVRTVRRFGDGRYISVRGGDPTGLSILFVTPDSQIVLSFYGTMQLLINRCWVIVLKWIG